MSDTLLVFEGASLGRLLLGAGVLAVALALAWRGLRGGGPRRLLLGALRAAGLLVLLVAWLEPALQERLLRPEPRRVAVLVDVSASMALGAGQGTRAELVRDFLAREAGALEALGRRHALSVQVFDVRPRASSLEALSAPPEGEGTDLLAALAGLGADPAGPQAGGPPELAGVILLSDGADNAGLERSGPEVEAALRALPAPVNTFCACPGEAPVDLAVARLEYDELAFVRNAVELEVHLESSGLPRLTVPVVLEQAGRLLASREVELEPGRPARVQLRFVPDHVGKALYRVRVPAQPGELVLENNTRAFSVRVVRDKIRVLHVVGRPSWDERFLRQLLKRNPNVDLVSFFILRTVSDSPGVGPDELSLIPFPVAELFGEELSTFDAVVFQNFNHGPYQVSLFLPHLRRYVEEGGAFLMLGGDLSFGNGRYGGSELEAVLPVRLGLGDDLVVEQVRPLPSAAGSAHPVLALGEGDALWGRLPPWGAYHRAAGLQPGALALLEHPFDTLAGARTPLVAVREVGRGRTAAILTDGLWRWNFWYAGQAGGSPRPYHRLVNNLLRWLIRDPDLEAVELRAERARVPPREPLTLEIRHAGAQGRARFSLLDTERDQVVETRDLGLDGSGRQAVVLQGLPPGAYQASLEVELEGLPAARAEETFVVEGAGREALRPLPRPDLLERLAVASGGFAGRLPEDGLERAVIDPRPRLRVEASTTRPLLGRAWFLIGLVGLLAAEWFLRRRWGFA